VPNREDRSTAEPLEFREVTKRYPGASKPAVDKLSLEVPAGEICVLVGPSGCGKTTAMRMVNRMNEITSGDILLGGRSVKDRKPAELRREIGYVIQHIGLFPHWTIAENIATVLKLRGWNKARIASRVEELLELIGLPAETSSRYPAQLSGGQRQRVGVARALAADPPVMLMDEPFGAIDPITRDRLQDEFLEIQRTVGKTIAFVTHDLQEAVKLGDRIAVFATGGRLAQYDEPETVLTRPADDFVSDFVGGGAAVRRLSLLELSRLELHPMETESGTGSGASAVGNRNGTPVAEVDAQGRPVSWRHLADRDAAGTTLVTVPLSGTVYDAVDVMLDGAASLVAVVDDEGVAQGVLHWNDLVAGLKTRERSR
jgi:osmoprotectant transport system ATP-binding protein